VIALLAATPLYAVDTACVAQSLPDETIAVPEAAWARLQALRREPKFVPHDYPPLGYVGPDMPEDLQPLTRIVDQALDGVLALKAATLSAMAVRPVLRNASEGLATFATEDRDRAWGYLVEIWYILGFHVPLFEGIYGEAFQIPEGYGEPLPPGWSAPGTPRPIQP
jgi:hypothetical protein